jgi:hypothetical protein
MLIGREMETGPLNTVGARAEARQHSRTDGRPQSVAMSFLGARTVAGSAIVANSRVVGSSHAETLSACDPAKFKPRERPVSSQHVTARSLVSPRTAIDSQATALEGNPSTLPVRDFSREPPLSPCALHFDSIQEDEWTEYIDDATGRPYFHNSVTNVTRWDRPTVHKAAA